MKIKISSYLLQKRFLTISIIVIVHLGCASEKSVWEETQSIHTIHSYEEFLKRYPEGTFAHKARAMIEELYFKEAQSIDTISSYEEFLASYPEGPLATKARCRIKIFYNERKPVVRHTRNAKILIDESYGNAKDFSSFLIRHIPACLSEGTGLKVLENNAKESDATLKIKVRGNALGANYSILEYVAGDYCYTGASLSGEITLKISGNQIYKKIFKGYVPPPEKINVSILNTEHKSKPSDAPFDKALRQSGFVIIFMEMIKDLYGPHPLIHAMKYPYRGGRYFKDVSKKILIDIGKPAVDHLVFALGNSNRHIRRNAADVLDTLGWEPGEEHEKIAYLFAKESWSELEEVGKPAVTLLISALNTSMGKGVSKRRVIDALCSIGNKRAVEALISVLENKNTLFQREVEEVFGEMDIHKIEAYITLLKNQDVLVKTLFLKKLRKTIIKYSWKKGLKDHLLIEYLYDYKTWSEWWEENKTNYLE